MGMSKNKSKIQDTCDQQEPSSVSSGRYLDKVIGFSRDENGFLNGVEYIFNTDCTINWRAMIKPEHLVPNRDSFKDSNINLKEIRCEGYDPDEKSTHVIKRRSCDLNFVL